ncbi:hypothetical protein BZM27_09285 [Paraburkholderia steynii]|uniref:Uncharacterized protein n=1 Tax=Paraburkholderia steynii TaxID=1245441 RepID=A0A4R0XEC0_9BURK|nr:hypothetical protein BZM27_09285 [Paraburkholderia steynii]
MVLADDVDEHRAPCRCDESGEAMGRGGGRGLLLGVSCRRHHSCVAELMRQGNRIIIKGCPKPEREIEITLKASTSVIGM